jgi:hypothetical protein
MPVTATLDLEMVDEVTLTDRPCECERPDHHPNHDPHCDQDPKYAVRIRHLGDCADTAIYWLCQNCLDEAMRWAGTLVGAYCNKCMKRVLAVSDLVGPVMPL